jgi:hypothetical protein
MTLPITIDEIRYAVVLLIGAGWPSSTVVHKGGVWDVSSGDAREVAV